MVSVCPSCRRRLLTLALSAICALLPSVHSSRAALVSMVSDSLSERPVPDFEGETLDGRILGSSELRGQAIVVNFFASWCPICQAQNEDLRRLHADYGNRGVRFLGVLVDAVETPDTLVEARASLAKNPLPYPVVFMNEAMGAAFQYQGFPATYFIRSDGTFTTTLLGYHPPGKLSALAANLGATGIPSASSATPGAGTPVSGTIASHPWDANPWLALVPRTWRQWHPIFVHFPIALLVIEASAVLAYWFRPSESLENMSRALLWLATVSLAPTIYTGVGDVGADLGGGWAFWNGLEDRVDHFFRLESSVSLHVIFALAASILAVSRLAWRLHAGERALQGKRGVAFAALTVLGLWLLFGAGQVGGAITHP